MFKVSQPAKSKKDKDDDEARICNPELLSEPKNTKSLSMMIGVIGISRLFIVHNSGHSSESVLYYCDVYCDLPEHDIQAATATSD